MSSKSKYSDEEKLEIVKSIIKESMDHDLDSACKKYGISSTTFYRWTDTFNSVDSFNEWRQKEWDRHSEILMKRREEERASYSCGSYPPSEIGQQHRGGGATLPVEEAIQNLKDYIARMIAELGNSKDK